MSDLLCLFSQEAHYGPYHESRHAVILVAASDMVAAQAILKADHVLAENYLMWGACKIIKGARISGDARIISILG